MGYYTRYELDIVENSTDVPNFMIIENLRNFSEGARYALYENGESIDETKWYDSSNDLLAYSLKNPNVVFCLSGEGEESGDIWRTYFKNGKSQYCKAKLTFDDFDVSKLK